MNIIASLVTISVLFPMIVMSGFVFVALGIISFLGFVFVFSTLPVRRLPPGGELHLLEEEKQKRAEAIEELEKDFWRAG